MDDADWLLSADPYGSTDTPGRDFGLTLTDTVSELPQEVLIVATMSVEAFGRLKVDPKHERWLGRLTRREVILDDLDDDALVEVLVEELGTNRWQFDGPETKSAARRMLSDHRNRKAGSFSNAIACSRASELLIEIVKESYPHLASTRTINRDAVREADKEID